MKQIFEGEIENGKIKLKHPDSFRTLIAALKNGTRVNFTVSRLFKDRSNNQNRYYWGVVIKMLGEHFGEFSDDMHENVAWMFLKVQDKPYPKRKSTASLSTAEFEDYLQQVRDWAMAEHEVRIPMPNEIDFDEPDTDKN